MDMIEMSLLIGFFGDHGFKKIVAQHATDGSKDKKHVMYYKYLKSTGGGCDLYLMVHCFCCYGKQYLIQAETRYVIDGDVACLCYALYGDADSVDDIGADFRSSIHVESLIQAHLQH